MTSMGIEKGVFKEGVINITFTPSTYFIDTSEGTLFDKVSSKSVSRYSGTVEAAVEHIDGSVDDNVEEQGQLYEGKVIDAQYVAELVPVAFDLKRKDIIIKEENYLDTTFEKATSKSNEIITLIGEDLYYNLNPKQRDFLVKHFGSLDLGNDIKLSEIIMHYKEREE